MNQNLSTIDNAVRLEHQLRLAQGERRWNVGEALAADRSRVSVTKSVSRAVGVVFIALGERLGGIPRSMPRQVHPAIGPIPGGQ